MFARAFGIFCCLRFKSYHIPCCRGGGIAASPLFQKTDVGKIPAKVLQTWPTHRRSAYCRYWGLASLSPITSTEHYTWGDAGWLHSGPAPQLNDTWSPSTTQMKDGHEQIRRRYQNRAKDTPKTSPRKHRYTRLIPDRQERSPNLHIRARNFPECRRSPLSKSAFFCSEAR